MNKILYSFVSLEISQFFISFLFLPTHHPQ